MLGQMATFEPCGRRLFSRVRIVHSFTSSSAKLEIHPFSLRKKLLSVRMVGESLRSRMGSASPGNLANRFAPPALSIAVVAVHIGSGIV